MLHLFCGKIAAGKSTLAREIADADGGVVIAEDAWLSTLYGDKMQTTADFMRYSATLRAAMAPHVTDLLRAGVTVVLDFQANTRDARGWMRGLIDASGADHRLHVLTPPDAVCLARLAARNASGKHPFSASEAQFHRISKFFSLPAPEEGFTLVLHEA